MDMENNKEVVEAARTTNVEILPDPGTTGFVAVVELGTKELGTMKVMQHVERCGVSLGMPPMAVPWLTATSAAAIRDVTLVYRPRPTVRRGARGGESRDVRG